jgi:peptidyl-tRNA hydrolase
VVVRKDLSKPPLGWGAGPIMAQACHAVAAAIWLSKDTADTQAYCAPDMLDNMTKVTMESNAPYTRSSNHRSNVCNSKIELMVDALMLA